MRRYNDHLSQAAVLRGNQIQRVRVIHLAGPVFRGVVGVHSVDANVLAGPQCRGHSAQA